MDEIPGGIVTPELNLPCRLKGCILIINMVQSLKLAETIGVVQPAGFRHQVVGQAAVIRLDPFPVLPVLPVPCFIILPADLFIFFQASSSLPLPCLFCLHCLYRHISGICLFTRIYGHIQIPALRQNHHSLGIHSLFPNQVQVSGNQFIAFLNLISL